MLQGLYTCVDYYLHTVLPLASFVTSAPEKPSIMVEEHTASSNKKP